MVEGSGEGGLRRPVVKGERPLKERRKSSRGVDC